MFNINKNIKISICCFVFFQFLFNNTNAQKIDFGQNAEFVKNQIKNEVESYYRAKGYHQVQMSYDVKRDNTNKIERVILCKNNVPMADFSRPENLCTHYIMDKGILNKILNIYENVSIDELSNILSKDYIKIGVYFFDKYNNDIYSIIYVSNNGLAVKEIRSSIYHPIPNYILSELNETRNKIRNEDNKIYDINEAIKFPDFIEQEKSVMYYYSDGRYFLTKVNEKLINDLPVYIEAILSYYHLISRDYELSNHLNIKYSCSEDVINFCTKYIRDKEVANQIANCENRSDDYHLLRLEYTQVDSIISFSYCIQYFENNRSQDYIIGVDQFKVNELGGVEVIKISNKESFYKKSKIINSKIYDLEEFDSLMYIEYKNYFKKKLIKNIVTGDNNFPSIEDILYSMNRYDFNPSFKYKSNFDLHYIILFKDNQSYYSGNTLVVRGDEHVFIDSSIHNFGDDKNLKILNIKSISMPSINIDGVDVEQKKVKIPNIDVEIEKGISFLTKKKKKLIYVKYEPSDLIKSKILNKIATLDKGNYLIKYEIIQVMDEKYEEIEFVKVEYNRKYHRIFE